MREAVVVASSRTPLAKSFRGSFNMTRPDDLAAHCIKRRARQGASAGSRGDRGRDPRVRAAERRPGQQRRARGADPRRPAGLGGRHHRQSLLLLGAAGDRHGRPPDHPGRRGRRHRRRRREHHDDEARRRPEPLGEGEEARHLHGDGRHGGGRRQALQRQPPDAGRVLAREPAAHGARPAGRLLQGGAGAAPGGPRHRRQEDGRDRRQGGLLRRQGRVQPRRHDARGAPGAAAPLRQDQRPGHA